MERIGHQHTAKDSLLVWVAFIGGALLFSNWVWQGYLGLTPGKIDILQDSSRAAYYINELMLFASTCCLLYVIIGLRNAIDLKGFVWKSGFYISIFGMTLFALGTLGFTIYGFADSAAMPDVIGFCTGIGNIAMHFGALPLGIALLKHSKLLTLSALLFILQTPVVIIYLFGIIQLNTLFASILIGSFYGLGWILVGLSLSGKE